MDVRGAYIAWCTPSPFVLAVIAALTACWLILDAAPALAVFAGLGASALVWFQSAGPRQLVRSGTVASALLVGLSAWLTMGPRPHPREGLCTLILCALLALVMTMVLVRVQAVLEMATRLQARTLATPLETDCSLPPAALSAQLMHALSDGKPLHPDVRRVLTQVALSCAAAEKAQCSRMLRSRSFSALPVPSQQHPSQ